MSEKSTLSAYWFRRKTRNFAAQAEVPKNCLFFSDEKSNFSLLKIFPREGLSSGPMAKTPPSNAGGTGSIPCQDIYFMQLVEKKKIVAVKQFSSLRGQIQIIGKTPRARILCIITQAKISDEIPK